MDTRTGNIVPMDFVEKLKLKPETFPQAKWYKEIPPDLEYENQFEEEQKKLFEIEKNKLHTQPQEPHYITKEQIKLIEDTVLKINKYDKMWDKERLNILSQVTFKKQTYQELTKVEAEEFIGSLIKKLNELVRKEKNK